MTRPETTPPESDRILLVERLVRASPGMVWNAISNAEALAAWWGPTGFTLTTSRFEFRVGGEWIYVMHGPDGTDYPNRMRYREIVEPHVIRYHQDDGDDGKGINFEGELRLVPNEAGTTVRISLLFPTVEEKDLVVREFGAVEGGQQTLARLAAHLETA